MSAVHLVVSMNKQVIFPARSIRNHSQICCIDAKLL